MVLVNSSAGKLNDDKMLGSGQKFECFLFKGKAPN
jgi:hypothetical protein